MIIHRTPFIIHHFKSLGSTNDQLKEMITAAGFTCVVAEEQTAGRGRRARTWHSAPGDGLYLSILLLPEAGAASKIPLISLMASIAVAETLIGRGVDGVDIKWPNDVMINERKVSGILAEALSDGSNSMRLVLGIGVNLNHQSFPDELRDTATSVAIATGERVVVDEFRDQLLERIARWYELWRLEYHALIVDRWLELSTYAHNQRVIVTLDNERIAGATDGITETGALRLIVASGEIKTILAGEVTRLRKDAD